MARQRMHPIVEGAVEAVTQVGEKAVRRALESIVEDGNDAAREIARRAGRFHDQVRTRVPFDVRQVDPEPEKEEVVMPKRKPREAEEEYEDLEEEEDPEEEEDEEDEKKHAIEGPDRVDLSDAEVLLRQAWMLLADLADRGIYSRKRARQIEEHVHDLGDRLDE
jgi:hypothetical protein